MHYTTTTTAAATTTTTTLYYTTPHFTTLHYTTLYTTPYTTLYTTLYLHYTTLHQLHCATLHYTTTTTTTTLHYLHYITAIGPRHYTTITATTATACTTPHYIHPAVALRWPLQPFQKTQLQPPVGPSVASLCHPWFTTTNLSYWFPIFETSATALCGTTGTQKYFYTEMLHTEMTSHTETFLHIHNFTFYTEMVLRWAALRTDTITNRGAFAKEWIYTRSFYRRKFRSQTSDNMDRWKSRGGKSQRREEKRSEAKPSEAKRSEAKRREEKRRRREEAKRRSKEKKQREDQRRERVRGKKMQVREKVAKSRNTVFFQWYVAPEGRQVGSLKRRVRSHEVRWEMKSCTPLWRKAHVEVKMYKNHQVRTTGSWDVEKVHAAVARSTFQSQKCKKLTGSEHFWTFGCCFAWQAQRILHLAKSEQNVTLL